MYLEDIEKVAQECLSELEKTSFTAGELVGTGGLLGGASGAVVGGIRGAKKDKHGKRHIGKGVLKGGAAGAALGSLPGLAVAAKGGRKGMADLKDEINEGFHHFTNNHFKKKASVELELLAQEFLSNLEKNAGVKEMGSKVLDAIKSGGKGAMGVAKRYGQLMKGGKKGEFGDLKGRRAGNSLKGFKQWRSEAGKSLGARAGTAAAVAGGGYAAKKKLDRK